MNTPKQEARDIFSRNFNKSIKKHGDKITQSDLKSLIVFINSEMISSLLQEGIYSNPEYWEEVVNELKKLDT